MDQGPGPLSPELEAFLDAERRYPDAPDAARARVLARVDATLATAGATPAPAAAPAAAPGIGAALLAKPVVLALATFSLGVLTGVGAQRWVGSPNVHVAGPTVPITRPSVSTFVAPLAPAPPAAILHEPAPGATPSVAAPAGARSAGSRPSRRASRSLDELEAERIILQQARAQLAARDGRSALSTIEEHAREFPDGTLAEEREALAIRALLLTSRREDARARAGLFRRRHPQSIYLPAVEQALDSIR